MHLAQFGWRGPHWHLKCRGLAHTLSATSLSVSGHWRTGTESIRRGSTLKTALKTQCALSTLGVVITYLIKIIPKNRTFACAARAQAQPCSPPYAQHGTLQPASCCCEVILFHTPRRRTCTVVDAVFCMYRFSLNLIEAHAKTAHRSLVRSLNTVPLPVACRSAFCCCCEVILFHTPQRRTCTVVDAVFCMDRFSLNLIEAHAKTSRR